MIPMGQDTERFEDVTRIKSHVLRTFYNAYVWMEIVTK